MAKVRVRKGMPSVALTRDEFVRRARERFVDLAFEPLQREIDKVIDAAWNGLLASQFGGPILPCKACAGGQADTTQQVRAARCEAARGSPQVMFRTRT